MKDFVPCQESYELKQLGFDEYCLGYYNIDPYLPNPTFNLVKPFDHEWCLPAPLYQQAFRWFREKYNLVHEICEHPKEMIDYVAVASKGERYLPTYSYGYSSGGCYRPIGNTYIYEEAELGCLRKFIEIVKQKQ